MYVDVTFFFLKNDIRLQKIFTSAKQKGRRVYKMEVISSPSILLKAEIKSEYATAYRDLTSFISKAPLANSNRHVPHPSTCNMKWRKNSPGDKKPHPHQILHRVNGAETLKQCQIPIKDV